jgi:hypothetical protein
MHVAVAKPSHFWAACVEPCSRKVKGAAIRALCFLRTTISVFRSPAPLADRPGSEKGMGAACVTEGHPLDVDIGRPGLCLTLSLTLGSDTAGHGTSALSAKASTWSRPLSPDKSLVGAGCARHRGCACMWSWEMRGIGGQGLNRCQLYQATASDFLVLRLRSAMAIQMRPLRSGRGIPAGCRVLFSADHGAATGCFSVTDFGVA